MDYETDCPDCQGTGSEINLVDGYFNVDGDCDSCKGTGEANQSTSEVDEDME